MAIVMVLRTVARRSADILCAYFALWLANDGDTFLARALLKLEELREMVDSSDRLPPYLRIKLEAAIR